MTVRTSESVSKPADCSNLSHQEGLAGITTPPGTESASFPGMDTQEQAPWQLPAPRTQLIWAAVDLDGTLSEGAWTPESAATGGREIGEPIERNVRKAEELRAAGYKIVIYTARGWEHYEAVESWLDHHGVPYDRIVCGKLLAAVYVDDRAVESEQYSWHPQRQKERQAAALDWLESGYDDFPPA